MDVIAVVFPIRPESEVFRTIFKRFLVELGYFYAPGWGGALCDMKTPSWTLKTLFMIIYWK